MAIFNLRLLPRLLFALFFTGLFAWMLWEAWFGFGQISAGAALFPIAILVPAVVIAALATVQELLKHRNFPQHEPTPIEADLGAAVPIILEPGVERRRTLVILAWIVGFYLGICLVGWVITAPLSVLLYLKIAGRESWVVSVSSAILAWLFFDGVFDCLLKIPLSERLTGIFIEQLQEALGIDVTRYVLVPFIC